MKKILFNDKYGLTQAVLEGRKTMTRRAVSERLWDRWTDYDDWCNTVAVSDVPKIRQYYEENDFFLDNSPYKVGEVVAIAQSYKDCTEECIKTTGLEVTTKPRLAKVPGYKNKMFVRADLMPHHIRITDVKVERLNDITPDECLKEGIICKWHAPACRNYYYVPNETINHPDKVHETPQEAFAALIDKVSGNGVWESNPFVFAYEFELIN